MKFAYLGKDKNVLDKIKKYIDTESMCILIDGLDSFKKYYLNDNIDVIIIDFRFFSYEDIIEIKKIDPLIYIILYLKEINFLEVIKSFEAGVKDFLDDMNFSNDVKNVIENGFYWKQRIYRIFKNNGG